MIRIKTTGDFKSTESFLKKYTDKQNFLPILEKYGARGVELLQQNTPADSSKTAMSWSYEIEEGKNDYKIHFSNSNIVDGVNIAIILQYGHGTKNGGYVKGIDYINPAIKTAFEEMRDELVKEVKRV